MTTKTHASKWVLNYRLTPAERAALERIKREEGVPYQAQMGLALRAWLAGRAAAAAAERPREGVSA